MIYNRSLDYAIVHAIARRFIAPFKQWPAYKRGIIDEQGNVLRPLKTDDDKRAFTPLDNICLRIKKIIPRHLWYLLSFTQIFKGFERYGAYRSAYLPESELKKQKILRKKIKKLIFELKKHNVSEEEIYEYLIKKYVKNII